jgi:hypothetical protein
MTGLLNGTGEGWDTHNVEDGLDISKFLPDLMFKEWTFKYQSKKNLDFYYSLLHLNAKTF